MVDAYGLVDIRFGNKEELADWRKVNIPDSDPNGDDVESTETPAHVIAVLGFDPWKKKEPKDTELSLAIPIELGGPGSGNFNHGGRPGQIGGSSEEGSQEKVAKTDTPEFKKWFGDSKVVDKAGKPLVVYHGTTGGFTKFEHSKIGTVSGNTGWFGEGFYMTANQEMASDYTSFRENKGKDGANIMPVYVSLKNPLHITYDETEDTFGELITGMDPDSKERIKELDLWTDEERRIIDEALPDDSYNEQSEILPWSDDNPTIPPSRFTEALKDFGYDGVIVHRDEYKYKQTDDDIEEEHNRFPFFEIVAFYPEQIKSASGNKGKYNPKDPDITASSEVPIELAFNADQERDEKGRWSTGAGTSLAPDTGSSGSNKHLSESESRQKNYNDTAKAYKKWGQTLTETERDAVFDYQTYSYQAINDSLRGEIPFRDDVKQTIAGIDSALSKFPGTKHHITLYRGVGGYLVDQLKVGDTFTDKGYSSTSQSKKQAMRFIEDDPNSGLLVISCPKGAKAIPLDAVNATRPPQEKLAVKHSQSEYVLARGTTLKIVSIQKVKKYSLIHAELVSGSSGGGKKSSASPRKISMSGVKNSDHGKGWFYNTDTGKLTSINQGDLGPNGDHDGWVSVGDNAKSLGIPEKPAKAFQASVFGFDDESPKFARFRDQAFKYIDTNSHQDNPEFQKLFKQKFGMSIEDAQRVIDKLPLVRVRAWPDGQVSITNGESRPINWDTIRQVRQKIDMKGVDQILIADSEHYAKVDPKAFTAAKSIRDFPDWGFSLDLSLQEDMQVAADATNTEPTEGQHKAGNYTKGKFKLHGMVIAIENPVGSIRKGKDKDGTPWTSPEFTSHYGYVLQVDGDKAERGADKDHVDIFVHPTTTEDVDKVYVINQLNDEDNFDEHKAVIGAKDKDDALKLYKECYQKGWDRDDGVVELTVEDFKKWVQEGDKSKPIDVRWELSQKLDPSYDPEHPEECCPNCGARQERGDDGNCNRCGKAWSISKVAEGDAFSLAIPIEAI